MRKFVLFAVVLSIAFLLNISFKPHSVTLFLAGDSTCADKKELQASPERGWGQLLPTFLKTDKIKVENHAKNGRSTKSFISEGRWNTLLERVQKGDIVLIQFGHNDEKMQDTARYSDIKQYKVNLRRMVQDVQSREAVPILATPIVRRKFEKGILIETHGGYPDAVRTLAAEMQIALVDMHSMSRQWVDSVGEAESKNYYMHVAPGTWSKFPDGKIDDTHLNEAGALVMAGFVAKSIKQQHLPLQKYFRKEPSQSPVYTVPCSIK